MTSPTLSVCLINYNHGHFLQTRIPSILRALPDDAELLILDDCSTDNSREIIQQYAASDNRIRFFFHKKNIGVNQAQNFLLSKARGRYVSPQAADDIMLPNFYRELLLQEKIHPDLGIYCSDCGLAYEDGYPGKEPNKTYSTALIANQTQPVIFSSESLIKAIRKGFWIPCHSSIFKRELILNAGGYKPEFGHHSDWLPLHMIAYEAGVLYLPKTLSIWVQSANNFTNSHQGEDLKKVYRNIFKYLFKKENRRKKYFFKKTRLLQPAVKVLFKEIFWKPKYWSIIVPIVLKKLLKETKLCLQILKNPQ